VEDFSRAFYVITDVLLVSLMYDTLKMVTRVPKYVGVMNKTVQLNVFAEVHLLVQFSDCFLLRKVKAADT
jgi:hypothetical protein